MSLENTYLVTVEPGPDGPDGAMLERLSTIAAYRLATLEERSGYFPETGGAFDMLDCLDGKFFWDMSDEELEARPPTRIDFEIVSVDPSVRPATSSEVRVVVRIPT